MNNNDEMNAEDLIWEQCSDEHSRVAQISVSKQVESHKANRCSRYKDDSRYAKQVTLKG
jgi:hypothetical protein